VLHYLNFDTNYTCTPFSFNAGNESDNPSKADLRVNGSAEVEVEVKVLKISEDTSHSEDEEG
jgi:hypothetical protein